MMSLSLSPPATYKPALLEGGVIDRGIIRLRRNNKIGTASLAVISPGSYWTFCHAGINYMLTAIPYLNFTESVGGNVILSV